MLEINASIEIFCFVFVLVRNYCIIIFDNNLIFCSTIISLKLLKPDSVDCCENSNAVEIVGYFTRMPLYIYLCIQTIILFIKVELFCLTFVLSKCLFMRQYLIDKFAIESKLVCILKNKLHATIMVYSLKLYKFSYIS